MSEKTLAQVAYEYGMSDAMITGGIVWIPSKIVAQVYRERHEQLRARLIERGGFDGDNLRDDLLPYYEAGLEYEKMPEDKA